MRISDGISDVCSSDLPERSGLDGGSARHPGVQSSHIRADAAGRDAEDVGERGSRSPVAVAGEQTEEPVLARPRHHGAVTIVSAAGSSGRRPSQPWDPSGGADPAVDSRRHNRDDVPGGGKPTWLSALSHPTTKPEK